MTTYDYTVYDVTVTTLTPLHIGSGTTLLKDYDFAVRNGKTWRINEDALLELQNVDDPKLADTLAQTPPAQLLKSEDYTPDSGLFRYQLQGEPRAKGAGAELQEQIKTVHDELYLPGSSLKGAIRTALAWHGWTEQNIQPGKHDFGDRPKFAGQKLEKDIMGPDPNHDVLRALQVSDSAPISNKRLVLINVAVMGGRRDSIPVELEAIQFDTPLTLTIKIDRALFGQWAQQHRLRLGGNPAWFNDLPALIQAHTRPRIETELRWFEEVARAKAPMTFYRQMLNAKLPPLSCFLQIGWGTGWDSKTYGSHLQEDARLMTDLIRRYDLSRGKHQPGKPFPASRRATVQVVHDQSGRTKQVPNLPPGWVLLQMKERKQ